MTKPPQLLYANPILIHVSLRVIAQWFWLPLLITHCLSQIGNGFLLILKVWKSSMHGNGSEEPTYSKFPKISMDPRPFSHLFLTVSVQTQELVILVLQGLKLLRMGINAATSVMHWSWFLSDLPLSLILLILYYSSNLPSHHHKQPNQLSSNSCFILIFYYLYDSPSSVPIFLYYFHSFLSNLNLQWSPLNSHCLHFP